METPKCSGLITRPACSATSSITRRAAATSSGVHEDGSQPSAKRPHLRSAAGTMPPVQNSRGRCTGSGDNATSSKSADAPWWVTGSPAQSLRITGSISSITRPLIGPATPTAPDSGCRGMPGTKVISRRPPDRRSSVDSCLATRTRFRPGRSRVVPSFRWELWAAANARAARGSSVGAVNTSGSQIESNPSPSMSSTRREKPAPSTSAVAPMPTPKRTFTGNSPAGDDRAVRHTRPSRHRQRRSVEPVDGGEGFDRLPAQSGRLAHRLAQGQHPGHRHGVGHAEQLLDRRLVPHHHGGHDPGQALGPGGQQDAPRERVDRCSADQGVMVRIAVDGGQPGEVGQEDEHDRDLVEVLGEPTRANGCGLGDGRGTCDRPVLQLAVGDHRPRGEAGRHLGQVLVPAGKVDVPHGPAEGWVLHQNDPPGLAVAPVGCESGVVQHPVDRLVGDGRIPVLTHRPGGAKCVDQFHPLDGSGAAPRPRTPGNAPAHRPTGAPVRSPVHGRRPIHDLIDWALGQPRPGHRRAVPFPARSAPPTPRCTVMARPPTHHHHRHRGRRARRRPLLPRCRVRYRGSAPLVVAVLILTGCSASAPTAGHSAPATSKLPGATAAGTSTPTAAAPAAGTSTTAAGTGALSLVVEPDDDYRSTDQLIASAHHTIDMTMYELADTQAQALLIAARQRGVAIRVVLDQADSGASVNQSAYGQLQGAGVPVRWAPDGVIFHQKTVTVDGAVSAIMTGNLTSQFYGTTRDFVVMDRAPAAVAAIEAVFADDWDGRPITGGSTPDGLVWSPGAEPALVGLIDAAHRSVSVENEEMDSTPIVSALEAAGLRGVLVEVTMTANSEWDTAFAALTGAGVRVATYPDSPSALYVHAKAIVVDGSTAFVGSQNFSTSSLDDNRELGLVTGDPAVVGPLAQTLAGDFAGATPFAGGPGSCSPAGRRAVPHRPGGEVLPGGRVLPCRTARPDRRGRRRPDHLCRRRRLALGAGGLSGLTGLGCAGPAVLPTAPRGWRRPR